MPWLGRIVLLGLLAGCAFEPVVFNPEAACSEDCTDGQLCVAGGCLTETGGSCGGNDDCVETCIGGTCAVLGGLGEVCDDAGDCATDHVCHGGATCLLDLGVGCDSNSHCAGTCVEDFCVEPSDAGEACDDVEDCASVNAECLGDLCRLPMGSDCDDNIECAQVCIAGACDSPSDLFGPCDELGDCQAGLTCDGDVCKKTLGEGCGGDASQCASGFCVDGVCCDAACDGLCADCDAAGHCGMPSDDGDCGNIECDGLDSDCRDFRDLTTARCLNFGVCKTTDDCNLYDDAPDGTLCRDASVGACDVADVCQGGLCPNDVEPAGEICRLGGTCDAPETCDGVSPACPPVDNTSTCGVTNYRSIGVDTGTLFATVDCVVDGAGNVSFQQTLDGTVNIGRGDRVTFNGDPTFYYILSLHPDRTGALMQAPFAATSGACSVRRAYNSIGGWQTGQRGSGNLGTELRTEVGVMYADGPFDESVTITSFNANAQYHVELVAADGNAHTGVAGTGVRLVGSGHTLTIATPYTVVRGLEVDGAYSASGSVVVSGGDVRLDRLLVHGINGPAHAIFVPASAGVEILNTVVYDVEADGIHFGSSSTGLVANCTVFRASAAGVRAFTASVTVTNTLAVENGTDLSISAGHAYNMTTADGLGLPFFVDTTAGSENLHLAPSSPAIDAGQDLSNAFWHDFENDRRGFTPWDVGADEDTTTSGYVCGIDCPPERCCCGSCLPKNAVCEDTLCSPPDWEI